MLSESQRPRIMFRKNPNLRSIAVLVSLVAVCLVGAGVLRANLARPVVRDIKPPKIAVGWSIPVRGVRHIYITHSGERVCTVSEAGEVACYDDNGVRSFAATSPGATRAITSPSGACTMVYSHKDPANTTVSFLDGDGEPLWKMDVLGAVWSADAIKRGRDTCFVVGTGRRYVYAVTVGERRKRYRRWRAPGVVASIAADRSGDGVVYGTWQDSSISHSDLYGHRDWSTDQDQACIPYVQALGGSEKLLVRLTPNNSDASGEAAFLQSDGTVIGSCAIDADGPVSTMPSPDGEFVCAGYTKSIKHSDKSAIERHAALYDSSGRKLWDKGSMLMQITPMLVTAGGYVLVDCGKKTLFVISPSGELKQACQLPAPLLHTTASRDGSRALVTCADGRAYILRISH